MHNADLDAARDHIAGRVDAPMFDDLVARGARLRRFRLGVTAAAITVLVGGAVVGVDQPWVPPTARFGPRPGPRRVAPCSGRLVGPSLVWPSQVRRPVTATWTPTATITAPLPPPMSSSRRGRQASQL